MSFRKEKKYRLTYSDMAKVESQLLTKGMKKIYPSRTIKSLYFDNSNLDMYHDSEEGVLPRKKIRIRWYNESNKFIKETKISSIEGRFKFTLVEGNIETLKSLLRVRIFDVIYGSLSPVLIVEYVRYYYEIEKLRITLDRHITYRKPRIHSGQKISDSECVMEVKVPIECDDDYIERLIPHPVARFSKYSRGLLSLEKKL